MADSIKLKILDAMATDISGVSTVQDTELNPVAAREISQMGFPFVAMFDIEEQIQEEHNQIEKWQFPFHVQIWCVGENYTREAENIRAEIKQALYNGSAVSLYKIHLKEETSTKFYAEDEGAGGGLGGLFLTYNIVYYVNRLNPFSQTP